ncbi:kinase-like domain-containing protein [Cubamyces lactineus]|nr:kinase-like domain-containing protein [Cubamyces lactineus]
MNGLMRAARAVDGRDVVIRVIRVGSDGESHLEVLKYISRGLCSQVTPNHAIPLFELFELGDITFGIFPRVGCGMLDAYDSWPQNSVGDIVDMIMQCLETLGYLHSIGVAHRDAFKDNFLVQWHPESLSPRQITVSRPRVYLNDFETAVRFDLEIPPSQRTCVGPPLCASFPRLDEYTRPMPDEVVSGQPYDPFKLDVWQFGTSLSDMKTTIPDIDAILSAMIEHDPLCRIGALEAMKRMSQVVQSMVPETLKIAPFVTSQLDVQEQC